MDDMPDFSTPEGNERANRQVTLALLKKVLAGNGRARRFLLGNRHNFEAMRRKAENDALTGDLDARVWLETVGPMIARIFPETEDA